MLLGKGNGSVPETVRFIGLHLCYSFLYRRGKGAAELHFLDFLSGFAYNKPELIWITIAI